MVHRNLVSSLFWAGIGVVFCLGSLRYGFGSAGVPGAGFLPFLTGLSLLGLSTLNLLLAISKDRSRPSPPPAPPDYPAKDKAKRILAALGAFLFYVVALERLGFVITSIVFMTVIIALDYRKWPFVLLASCSFTALFYTLFRLVLRVPLPLGVLGL